MKKSFEESDAGGDPDEQNNAEQIVEFIFEGESWRQNLEQIISLK